MHLTLSEVMHANAALRQLVYCGAAVLLSALSLCVHVLNKQFNQFILFFFLFLQFLIYMYVCTCIYQWSFLFPCSLSFYFYLAAQSFAIVYQNSRFIGYTCIFERKSHRKWSTACLALR